MVDAQAEITLKTVHTVIPPAVGLVGLIEHPKAVCQTEGEDFFKRGFFPGR